MIEPSAALGVVVIALGMVLTPGPNMVYLTSRAISQGRRAGLVSLAGTAVGFLCYLLAATAGLSALFVAVPAAYTAVRIAGGLYLAWLAWGMLRPGGRSPFEARDLAPERDRRLFGMGLLTNLLNPKIALMYAALLPQFVDPADGATGSQLLQLGAVQIAVAVTVNGLIVLTAASVSGFLAARPRAMTVQRWVAGTVLGGFAVRTALAPGPATS
ncbi:LysE family translocator [Pseudonocardia alni]|uniref:Threonine/homoserine/homoserine lactone efflux protein n=1 Tax=Pseudonocardia alni TaxID=33907 RepID=A0AA44UUD1_PSEA5|nr:LysE family translocator [Pseudonocardia alni]MYW73457.1 LysE family transporter [Pseudonocardia sp. SID8383]OJG05177.1 Leucine efflux protein [Pseudonocardia autotrophica]PKB33690.1 threonine/homoserine/homoserine lactone efflux protein [Pseudonocardia alni]